MLRTKSKLIVSAILATGVLSNNIYGSWLSDSYDTTKVIPEARQETLNKKLLYCFQKKSWLDAENITERLIETAILFRSGADYSFLIQNVFSEEVECPPVVRALLLCLPGTGGVFVRNALESQFSGDVPKTLSDCFNGQWSDRENIIKKLKEVAFFLQVGVDYSHLFQELSLLSYPLIAKALLLCLPNTDINALNDKGKSELYCVIEDLFSPYMIKNLEGFDVKDFPSNVEELRELDMLLACRADPSVRGPDGTPCEFIERCQQMLRDLLSQPGGKPGELSRIRAVINRKIKFCQEIIQKLRNANEKLHGD
ncbi:MAG: hypothetical protein LBR92_00235 [Puniceicoccales bacterium]|jgi:hypothetical protein|nr:hypothetical protein [Puniceicoccales bacterium]